MVQQIENPNSSNPKSWCWLISRAEITRILEQLGLGILEYVFTYNFHGGTETIPREAVEEAFGSDLARLAPRENPGSPYEVVPGFVFGEMRLIASNRKRYGKRLLSEIMVDFQDKICYYAGDIQEKENRKQVRNNKQELRTV